MAKLPNISVIRSLISQTIKLAGDILGSKAHAVAKGLWHVKKAEAKAILRPAILILVLQLSNRRRRYFDLLYSSSCYDSTRSTYTRPAHHGAAQ